jgi:23S rRNA G2445 N2-methylase RlmL
MKYFSTFISGFQDVVEQALKGELSDVKVLSVADGLITYETSSGLDKIQRLKFFNNNFVLLAGLKGHKDLSTAILGLNKDAEYAQLNQVVRGNHLRYFRVTASKENQTTPIPPDKLQLVEAKISKQLGIRIHRTLPDIEFWFFLRDDGEAILGARLAGKSGKTNKEYQKGELRQELAHLLVLLSEPNKDDDVLEPFVGSGAILFARIQDFPYHRMYASEIDLNKSAPLIRKTSWAKDKIHILQEDALSLPSIADHSIDKIITDPPWGEFGPPLQEDINKFNGAMLESFDRVLKPNSIAVLLLSRQIDFGSVVGNSKFQIVKQLDVLVNGKKASVYVLKKS